jgi:hypothetical protein
MKNLVRLFLTFNNNIFNSSYKYRSYTDRDLEKNIKNFELLERFSRFPYQWGNPSDIDFVHFKIHPTQQNIYAILRHYSEFRDDVERLEHIMLQYKSLRQHSPNDKDVLSLFDFADNLDDLEDMVYHLFSMNKMVTPSSFQHMEVLKLEKKVVAAKSALQNDGFMLQIAGIGLALLVSYFNK